LGGDIPSIVDNAVQSVTGGSTLDVLGQSVTPEDLSARIQAGVADAIGSPSDVVHAARVALEWSLKVFLVLLVFVYLLVDGQRLGVFLQRFVPSEHRYHVETVAGEIHRLLGRYLQGQLLLVAIVSVVVFVGLEWVFRLRYALPIAVATGFLEIIPFLGPIAAGVIASAVALTQHGPAAAGWVALFYLVLRQLEDQLVMPVVVGRAVHVHPLATIFAVVVGEQVAGVLGMLLAVPLTAAAKVALDYAYPPADPELEHPQTRHVRLKSDAGSTDPSAAVESAVPATAGPIVPTTPPASAAPAATDAHHAL
jgi:predicted PurR-regulated permease PerM